METKTPAKPKQPAGGWKKRLVFSAIVSAALTFTLCLFGPLDLFFNNYEEIWFHLQDIIGGLFLVAGIFFVLTTLVGTLLRGKLHDIYMALMFGGLVGTYVQASFMNKDYGLLNGTSVDWSAYTGYGVVNTVIWLVCILVPLIAMLIWKEKKVRPVFLFLSCALILMQGASLVVSYINYPTTTESVTLTNDKLFDLSKDENTIIYLVDTMDGAFLQDMMERHPEYADRLQGFTNYTNARTHPRCHAPSVHRHPPHRAGRLCRLSGFRLEGSGAVHQYAQQRLWHPPLYPAPIHLSHCR